MKTIVITDDRYSSPHPVAFNGTIYRIAQNVPTEVPDEIVSALRDSSVAFEEVAEPVGGSGVEPPTEPKPKKKTPAKKKAKK